ncbi:voltage-dependent anion channel [Cladorrhinum sp. PSN259]|nr:voltage-dependent anion channel [Cladorrhinum sp. PSN259]
MPASLAFVALILRLLPSTLSISFPGLVTISTVLFLVALAGYAVTSVLFLARLLSPPNIRLRHRSLPLIERDSIKLGFVQYCPAGLALSAAAFGSFAVAEGRVPDRKGWAMAVYVCWWVSAALMAFLGFFTLAVYMSHSTVLVRSKTAHGRGLPLVAVLEGVTGGATVALVGAVMCLPGAGVVAGFEGRERIVSDGMAAPVVVFSYCVVGAVLLLALMAYAVVVHELLLVTGWPPPELTSVMFYLVGPLGQCAAALLVLGEAAGTGHYLGDLYRGNRSSPGLGIGVGIGEEEDMIRRKVSPLSPPLPAVPIGVISLLFAMMLFGMAVMWLVLALIAVGYRLHRGELVWNESWNGAIFPLLTLAVCSSWLSFELQSGFFRILTCVLIIICLVKFLVIVAFNARLAVSSSVFRPSRQ